MSAELNRLVIRNPCPEAWENMEGDERTRFCSQCCKSVYNLSELSTEQIGDLIERKDDAVCGRLFRRTDGTIVTRDVESESASTPVDSAKRFQFSIAGLLVMIAGSSAVFASIPWVTRTIGPWIERHFASTPPPPPPWMTVGVMMMGEIDLPDELTLGELPSLNCIDEPSPEDDNFIASD